MDQKSKHDFYLVAFGAVLFNILWNLPDILNGIKNLLNIWSPVLQGCLIAFVLNVPMVAVERLLHRIAGRSSGKAKRNLSAVSLTLTLVLVAGIFCAFGTLIIPPLISSAYGAAAIVEQKLPVWGTYLEEHGINADWISSALSVLKKSVLGSTSGTGVSSFFTSVTAGIFSTLGNLAEWMISLIIAVYLLMGKKTLYRQCRMTAYAFLPEKFVAAAGRIWNRLCTTYSQFFGGQCLEACILGALMFTAFLIFRLPYAGLIAVMTALSSFIPYIGSFLSCAVGALLILMISPMQALISVVVYQVVQFCENQFIYPRVVGGAVGLPALWTLIAVLIGGKTGGIVGMLFCIPLVSVLYSLAGEAVRNRLNRKKTLLSGDKEKQPEDGV